MGIYIKNMKMPKDDETIKFVKLLNGKMVAVTSPTKSVGDIHEVIETDIYERHRDCNGRFSATPSDGEWLEIESLDGEKWKPIKGFEGKYAVSNMGRIRNAVRVLSQRQYSRYLKVTLSDGKDRKTRMVHRLVAEAFVPNPHNYPQVNHKDENKHNNRADNLEWCTAKYNLYYGKTPPIKNLVHMEDAVIEAEGE